MVKRKGYLLEKIATKENIELGDKNSRKNKSVKTRFYISQHDLNKEEDNSKILDSFKNGKYKTSKYKTDIIYEPKERILSKLPYYPDRIAHCAIMISDVQRHINILVTHITACCNGRQKTTGGYIWKRQFNARLKLDRERLSFDKDKTKTDAELKRQQIKKSSKTSSK